MLAQVVVDEGEGSEQPTPSPTQPSIGDQPPMTESSYSPDTTQHPRVNLEGTGGSQGDHVQKSHDSPLSGGHTSNRAEGGLNLEELSVFCTNLSNRVLALETSKGAQAAEILKLKTRIKKLMRKCQPVISHHKAWLRSVFRLSMKKKLGKKESVSKQGRKNAKSGPKFDDSAFDDLDADLACGMDGMETEEAVDEGRQSNETDKLNLEADTEVIVEDKGSEEKGGSTVSTARLEVSTARPDVGTARQKISTADPTTPPTTTTIFDDEEMTLADTLVKMKDNKAKGRCRGCQTVRSRVASRGGKGKKREQQASMDYITNLYDEVQARIDADHELAARLTHEEQEKYTVDERAKLLAEFFKRRKKQLAEERAVAIRNKPPTRTQLRSLMITYLKHTVCACSRFQVTLKTLHLYTMKRIFRYLKGKPKLGLWYPRVSAFNLEAYSDSDYARANLDRKSTIGEAKYVVAANCYGQVLVHTLTLEDGTEIHMLAERKYPLIKETLERMLSLKLLAESLASPRQTALGKDFSNPLMADSLSKTIWLSINHVVAMKHWLFQSKRLLLLICYKDDKDRKQINVKYYNVTKEFKFIKEQINE
ncbi:hypothetical protein Tco_0413022 [Tanacetum coccineum]